MSDESILTSATKGVKLSEKMEKSPKAFHDANIPDLEKLAKFRYKGKTLTLDDLQKMGMMQNDYQKKTQELAKERKYWDNLDSDLGNVRDNPKLANEFKKLSFRAAFRFLRIST